MWFDYGYGELLTWLSVRTEHENKQEYTKNFRCRRIATQVFNSRVQKPITEHEFWPLDDDGPAESSGWSLDSAESITSFGEMMRATNLPMN